MNDKHTALVAIKDDHLEQLAASDDSQAAASAVFAMLIRAIEMDEFVIGLFFTVLLTGWSKHSDD